MSLDEVPDQVFVILKVMKKSTHFTHKVHSRYNCINHEVLYSHTGLRQLEYFLSQFKFGVRNAFFLSNDLPHSKGIIKSAFFFNLNI